MFRHVIIFILIFICSVAKTISAHAFGAGDCPNGALTLKYQKLGESSFGSLPAGCSVTIEDCTAEQLSFDQPVERLSLHIRNLDCGTVHWRGECILFSSDVTATSIEIDGVRRTWSTENTAWYSLGAVNVGGRYNIVRFAQSVVADRISVRNVHVKTSLASLGSFTLQLVRFEGPVTAARADGSARGGSAFTIFSNSISGRVSSAGGVFVMISVCQAGMSLFETVEVGSNVVSVNAISDYNVGKNVTLAVAVFATMRLAGTETSTLELHNNSLRDIAAAAINDGAHVFVYCAAFSGAISDASMLHVDGCLVERAALSAKAGSVLVRGIYFTDASVLGMTGAGAINISNINMRSCDLDSSATATASGAVFNSLNGVRSISVANVHLDLSMRSASGAASAIVAAFFTPIRQVRNISVESSSIRGVYRATGAANVYLIVANFFDPVHDVEHLAIKNNRIVPSHAAAADGHVGAINVNFENNATAPESGGVLDVSNVSIAGSYTSNASWVALAAAAVDGDAELSPSYTILADDSFVDYTANGKCGGSFSNSSVLLHTGPAVSSDIRTKSHIVATLWVVLAYLVKAFVWGTLHRQWQRLMRRQNEPDQQPLPETPARSETAAAAAAAAAITDEENRVRFAELLARLARAEEDAAAAKRDAKEARRVAAWAEHVALLEKEKREQAEREIGSLQVQLEQQLELNGFDRLSQEQDGSSQYTIAALVSTGRSAPPGVAREDVIAAAHATAAAVSQPSTVGSEQRRRRRTLLNAAADEREVSVEARARQAQDDAARANQEDHLLRAGYASSVTSSSQASIQLGTLQQQRIVRVPNANPEEEFRIDDYA